MVCLNIGPKRFKLFVLLILRVFFLNPGSEEKQSHLHTKQTGSYFRVKDGEKAVHVHVFTDKLGRKNKQGNIRQCLMWKMGCRLS